MLNRRTQPLDPAVLQQLGLGNPSDPVPRQSSSVPATTPLKPPSALVGDFRSGNTLREQVGSVPSLQAGGISLAAGQSAQTTQNNGPMQSLNEAESMQLLDVSARIADLRRSDPAAFQKVLSALQSLSADASGRVSFAALDMHQKSALANLGLNESNTETIFKQLYQMVLPEAGNSSEAFQRVQAKVTGFISNLDLREQSVQRIQQNARDLTAVQGVVSSLSANSIEALLADQTAGVYDTGISQITSDNLKLDNAMDFTIGNFVVLSQQSPHTLQIVENAIHKIKSEQNLDQRETQLLNHYGLSVNASNKLQTIDGSVLDFNAVNQLENVLFSMKDPSQGYQLVLEASAKVLAQSGKLEQLGQELRAQQIQVQQTTHQVNGKAQEVEQLRQQTNVLNARLSMAQTKTTGLATAMDSATGLIGRIDLDPSFLSQFNIRLGTGAEQGKVFINGKESTRIELIQYLGQLMQETRTEITDLSGDLADKKVKTLQANAELNASTETLETQTVELEEKAEEYQSAHDILLGLVAERDQVIEENKDDLKPEELEQLETQINPAIEREVERVSQEAQTLIKEVDITVAEARGAIETSRQVQQAVQNDVVVWDKTLDDTEKLLELLDDKIEAGEKAIQKAVEEGAAPPEPADVNFKALVRSFFQSEEAPEETDSTAVEQAAEFAQKRAEAEQLQSELQVQYQQQQDAEKRFDETLDAARESRLEAQEDRQRLQEQVAELRGDE